MRNYQTLLRRLALMSFIVLTVAMVQGCTHGQNPWTAGRMTTTTPSVKKAPDSQPAIWPVEDSKRHISSGYGVKRGRHIHKGIDIIATKGSPVRATAPGKIVFSACSGAYGQMVVIDHGDGMSTAYAHLAKRYADVGQTVGRGEIIAEVGATGNASTPHLHYEVRKAAQPINPLPYLP